MKRRISLKRTIITLAFALLTTIVFAAKANPMPATIVQPDGKLLTIVLHGDEHAHYVATTDGVLLYREGNSYFVAKTDDDGELCPTPFLAHNAGQLLACALVVKTPGVLAYAPILAASGVITGVFTGFAAMYLIRALRGMRI